MTTPTGTESRVCADIAERQHKGIAKYGTTVADNPLSRKEWLQHAYEEALDFAVYLKRIMDLPEANFGNMIARLNADAETIRLAIGELAPQELRNIRAFARWVQGSEDTRAALRFVGYELPKDKPPVDSVWYD